MSNNIDELFNKELSNALIRQQLLDDQRDKEEEQRQLEEEQRQKEAEQRQKEAEQRQKEEQEKNNKTKKQFSEIVNSIETLENEDYANLLNRIEQLSDLELRKS